MVCSMMSQTTLLKSFWDYAFESDARILNMVSTKKVDKTPYEVWHGQVPKLFYLKVWGCEALVKHDTLTKPDKLEPKSFKYQEASGSLEDLEIIQEEDTHPSIDTSLNHEEDDQETDEPQSDINPIRRSTRTCHPTDRLCLYVDAEEHELGDLGEPVNYKDALLDPESDKWLNAMNVEMQSMKDNEVWELVDLPPNGKTVGHKWLFKKKTGMDGEVHTYKARLQMDVKAAFLIGYLNEEAVRHNTAKIPALHKYPYSLAVGSIMYAVRCTRPDVAFAQNITSRFQQNPSEVHWTAVKNILKYLRNTKDMFLVYEGDTKRRMLGFLATMMWILTVLIYMKSQTGYIFVLNGGVVD
ncbi:hypothetical protein Tco_0704829 [Tanacetum coccineum]|uniref:Reverse transcriptase Ty1/copia-type domain-containing protein n=1 Tax=Tanacetum coccineum TaxID=301880 RepID=A0ABQ4Y4V1_9ASTR